MPPAPICPIPQLYPTPAKLGLHKLWKIAGHHQNFAQFWGGGEGLSLDFCKILSERQENDFAQFWGVRGGLNLDRATYFSGRSRFIFHQTVIKVMFASWLDTQVIMNNETKSKWQHFPLSLSLISLHLFSKFFPAYIDFPSAISPHQYSYGPFTNSLRCTLFSPCLWELLNVQLMKWIPIWSSVPPELWTVLNRTGGAT